LYLFQNINKLSKEEDDDTASALSLSSSSDEGSCSDLDEDYDGGFLPSSTTTSTASSVIKKRVVTFCAPLVTQVRYRPMTSRKDKYYMHYNEHDYIDFKIEYLTGRERTHKVSFAREVVSEVHHTTPLRDAAAAALKEDLFYSESELQG
jgi:hypothetical protein